MGRGGLDFNTFIIRLLHTTYPRVRREPKYGSSSHSLRTTVHPIGNYQLKTGESTVSPN